jgi:hypothetical protein
MEESYPSGIQIVFGSRQRNVWPKGRSEKPASARRPQNANSSNTGTDKRFVRRGAKGRFTESDDLGKSLAADRRTKVKTKVTSGQGDRATAD